MYHFVQPCQIQMKKRAQPLARSPPGRGRAWTGTHNSCRSCLGHPVFLHRLIQLVSSQPQPISMCVSVAPYPFSFSICSPGWAGGFFIAAPSLPFLASVPQLAPGCVDMGNVFRRGTGIASSSRDPHVHDHEAPFLLKRGGGESARKSRPKRQSPADGLTQLAWPVWVGGS